MKIEHLTHQLNEFNKINFYDTEKYPNWKAVNRFLNQIDLEDGILTDAVFANIHGVMRHIQKSIADTLEKELEEHDKESVRVHFEAKKALLTTELRGVSDE